MTIQDLHDQNLLLFECVSGSRAYGTDLPHSDLDLKGVFILPKERYFGFGYVEQVSSPSNDEVYYEIGRFAELLGKNNPNILEMLASPPDCVRFCHPLFRPFLEANFLSKLCKATFAGFAAAQIKKAKGLNKKINVPVAPVRKTPLDFCWVATDQGSMPVHAWLDARAWAQERCGLAALQNMRDLYQLYYDESGELGFSGIVRKENANEVALTPVPKGMAPAALMTFNKDAYSMHCREYRAYQEWLQHRNEERYQNTLQHGKNYDAKNMMHTIRLLDTALEIIRDGRLTVLRPNRAHLLEIRSGTFTYEELLQMANARLEDIEAAFSVSTLPESPDLALMERLLVDVRMRWYG
jgi:uncharacterized protein